MKTKSLIVLICCVVCFATIPLAGQSQPGITSSAPSQVTISWSVTNQWLQTAPVLQSLPFSWVNVLGAPVATGGVNAVTLPATDPTRFFRLVNSATPPPTRLSVSVLEDGTFMLSWDSITGATSYKVYMASVSGVNQTNYSSLPDGTVTSGITDNYLSVSALTSGKRYFFVVTAVSGGESAESNEATAIYGPHAGVSGLVCTIVSSGGNPVSAPVPGVTLNLVNTNNPAINASVTSDAGGRFQFPDQPAGDYQLCWQAPGFVPGCVTQVVTIVDVVVDVGRIEITTSTNATNGFVYGRVLFQNGMPAMVQNNPFQAGAVPTVTLSDAGGNVAGQTVVNANGQYLISNVPRTNSLTLSAKLENAAVTNTVNTFVIGEADLVIPNSPPSIASVGATLAGTPVFRVPPGAMVDVNASASDPDGDTLTFRWFTSYAPVAGATSSNVVWTLPSGVSGFEYLFVRASDGKGGYANARIALVLSTNMQFSGRIVDDGTDAPITNATVGLNGVTTGTDANGYFALTVDTAYEYYLTIASSGYMPLDKFLTDETTDQEYRLLKISSNACIYDTFTAALVTNTSRVALEILPGTLVSSNGSAYSGNFSVSLDSLDPCSGSNSFAGGNLTTGSGVLDPYGFVNITVRDCSGATLFLYPSSNANLFLPVSTTCADSNSTPATAQFFTLPTNTNRWTATGLSTQVVIGVSGFAGAVASFGPVAAAAPAAPGALLISADRTLHVPFTIGIFKTNGTDLITYVDIFYQTAQGGSNISGQVVSNLPAGPVLVKILDLRQSPGEFYDQGVLVPRVNKTIIQIITNTVTANQTNTVIAGLGVGPGRVAQLAQLTNDAVNNLSFLDKVWPADDANLDAANPNAAFNQYYAVVDPGNQKDTFAKWQVANGWPTNNAGIGNFEGSSAGQNDDAFALYFNATELGAGRRMGMKTNGNNVAYYVATYASLADAESASKLKYIVCMEYSPHPTIEPANGYIKFYAYGKDGTRTGIVPDEDRHGRRYVPYVCCVCHGGGTFTPDDTLAKTTNNADVKIRKGYTDGQFIGFDIAGYTFSTVNRFSYTNLAASNTFTKLNQGLLKSAPIMPGKLLTNLIASLMVNNRNYTVAPSPDWETGAANVNLYNNTYAVSCRSCHSTQGNRWGSAAEYKEKDTGYGGSPTENTWGTMPQPQRTYSVFWGSATASKINTNVFNAPAALSGTNTQFAP